MADQAENYDVVILGAGPSGVEAAATAARHERSVAIVSDGKFMGYGLEGAFKSKSQYEIARAHHAVRHRWNLALGGYEINFEALSVANSAGAEALRRVHAGRLEKLGVTIIEGHGRFVDPHTVAVGERHLHGEHLLIATGTRPRVLPGMEPDGVHILTSDEVVDLARPIASMLILGAGVIGCEFASIFASFGTQVTLVDTKARIFSHDDEDLSEILERSFEQLGIRIVRSARCQGIQVVDGKAHTDLGDGEPIVTEVAVLAVGRAASTNTLGDRKSGG